MASFIVLHWMEGGSNAALGRIVIVDYVGIVFLLAAGLAMSFDKG